MKWANGGNVLFEEWRQTLKKGKGGPRPARGEAKLKLVGNCIIHCMEGNPPTPSHFPDPKHKTLIKLQNRHSHPGNIKHKRTPTTLLLIWSRSLGPNY